MTTDPTQGDQGPPELRSLQTQPLLPISWGSKLQLSLCCERGKSIFPAFSLGSAARPWQAADKRTCLSEHFLLTVCVWGGADL